MNKISGIIVVKNNPPFLFKSIASIMNLCQELIIVDIGIDPKIIPQLKQNNKIKIVKIDMEVPYVELIREKTKAFAKNDYILMLDPDEIFQPGLTDLIIKNIGKFDYFKLPRKNIIFNRWIKHSRWWPDYQIRVFNKKNVTWHKIIHRQPTAKGQVMEIPPYEKLAIVHYNYQNLDEYFSKALRYAKFEAKEFISEKKTLSFSETVRRGISEFVSRYFAARGWEDGIHGLILAIFQMFYYFLVYFYYLEFLNFKTNEKIDETSFFKIGLKETLYWKKNNSIKDRLIKKIL